MEPRTPGRAKTKEDPHGMRRVKESILTELRFFPDYIILPTSCSEGSLRERMGAYAENSGVLLYKTLLQKIDVSPAKGRMKVA